MGLPLVEGPGLMRGSVDVSCNSRLQYEHTYRLLSYLVLGLEGQSRVLPSLCRVPAEEHHPSL